MFVSNPVDRKHNHLNWKATFIKLNWTPNAVTNRISSTQKS